MSGCLWQFRGLLQLLYSEPFPFILTLITENYKHNEVNWILSVSEGTWTTGPSEIIPEAESSSNTLADGAVVQTCTGCSGSSSVGYIGGSPGGTLTFPNISSNSATTTTIRIHYTNGDSTQRYATVVVNGVSQVVAFVPTGSGSSVGSSTLTVALKAGSANVIEFEAYNGGWGTCLWFWLWEIMCLLLSAPDIDRLMVPVSWATIRSLLIWKIVI